MPRPKKTPMYESIITPSDVPEKKNYDFIDFTAPVLDQMPACNTESARESNVIRKIESTYRSQLLNIEQSKQEDCHVEQIPQSMHLNFGERKVLGDTTNNMQTSEKFMRLNTLQTLGGQFDDQINTDNSQTDRKCPFTDAPFHVRKSKTFFYESQNMPQPKSEFDKLIKLQKRSSFGQQNYLQRRNSNYFSAYSQFTSDDIVEIMADPYRSNLQVLKRRVKSNSTRML